MADTDRDQGRTIGLRGATGVGVGAIVGGGIFVLAGVAFAATGPGALLAFALNGGVAFITAMSFAEMACAFPQSGGAYNFAKKVLSVRAAFAVGWILWFAYIVAGVLYALGFASYAVLVLKAFWDIAGSQAPAWLFGRRMALLLACGATAFYTVSLIRKAAGGGQWATVGKVVVFVLLILVGVVAVIRQPLGETQAHLSPFFSGGAIGLVSAMGFTFIALQGFDLIAAIAGEVKDPGRNIPKAMFISLGLALAIYLPLLFLVSTVGVPAGTSITKLSAQQPDTVMAVAAAQFMGPVGYWFVVVAAILATLSALHANILAASRVALSMARDQMLPGVLGHAHPTRGTPAVALYASALTLAAILFMVPNLAAAGAAASLIFLVSFTLAHLTSILARVRGRSGPGKTAGYQTPWFPALPVFGMVACGLLAIYQAVVVPDAGGITLIWLGLGVLLYLSLFASRAETFDASAMALDPQLVRLRGKTPLVLLPIANPAHAGAMVAVANALAPRDIGRVLLLSIVPAPTDKANGEVLEKLKYAQDVVHKALTASFASGQAPEALITAAPGPWSEIRRIADEHDCESLVLGLGPISQAEGAAPGEPQLEELMNEVDCDVTVMRTPEAWRLDEVRKILVPVGGRGEQHELRARLIGSLCRTAPREVTFLRVLPATADDDDVRDAEKDVTRLAEVNAPGAHRVEVKRSDDPAAAVVETAREFDLVILGLKRVGRKRAAFGTIALRIARESPCATIMISRKHTGWPIPF